MMKNKRVILVLITVSLMLLLVSCTSDIKASVSEIGKAMVNSESSMPELKEISSEEGGTDLDFAIFCASDYSLVKDYYFACASDGSAAEIAVIKLKDSEDAGIIMSDLKAHVESRINAFETYDPSQVDMLQRAVVTHNGKYVTLIVCDNQIEAKRVFNQYFEE